MTLDTILVALGVAAALLGGAIMRDRQVHRTIAAGDEKLHLRVNRIQDVYVRREEFNQRMHALETTLNQMRQEQMAFNTRLDAFLSTLLRERKP